MKKRLFSLLAVATLTTTAWADISSQQLDAYMKASGADVVLDKMQTQMASSIEMRAKMRGKEIPSEILKGMTTILANKENLAKFTEGLKSLDEKDYEQIMKFYDTKIGKKNAALTKSMNLIDDQEKMVEYSKKELPKERDALLDEYIKVSMSEKKMEKITKVMMQSTVDSLPKEMQEKVQKRIDAQLESMKDMMTKQIKMSTAYAYRDYSNEELKSLINYYKTSPAQKEIDAMIDGVAEYSKSVMPKMINMMMIKSAK